MLLSFEDKAHTKTLSTLRRRSRAKRSRAGEVAQPTMNVQDFFNSLVMALPHERDEQNFELYLKRILEAYLREIKALDSHCHLCQLIRNAAGDIKHLSEWIRNAVRQYLSGKPAPAYQELFKGIAFMRLLLSLEIVSDEIGNLYRIADTEGKIPAKGVSSIRHFIFITKCASITTEFPDFPVYIWTAPWNSVLRSS